MTNKSDWVMVPREPTEAMLRAAVAVVPTWDDPTSRNKWAAMIAASPKPVKLLCNEPWHPGPLDQEAINLAGTFGDKSVSALIASAIIHGRALFWANWRFEQQNPKGPAP